MEAFLVLMKSESYKVDQVDQFLRLESLYSEGCNEQSSRKGYSCPQKCEDVRDQQSSHGCVDAHHAR